MAIILVEDLRTMALSDVGSLVLAREPLDPALLVNETVAAFISQAARAGVELSAEISGRVPMVEADPARMRGVLGNLFANAIRHTPPGGSVVARVSSSGPEVRISVTDTGEGIDPDLEAKAFERFVKGPGSMGSGLGLAIARDVVIAHGGTIGIESEPGAGTTVSLTLPPSS